MDERKHPCPKCETGELYDTNAGGMFCAAIRCNNPDCDYEDSSDMYGCVTGQEILMSLNRFRNKPCPCKSGMKFKHCCLQDHYKQQAGLVTRLAKKVQEKTAKYFQKRYKTVTDKGSK